MATYKQPCFHCGALVDSGSRFCPACGSNSPFGYACPSCLHTIDKNQKVCAGCGAALHVECPHCGGKTFAQSDCEICGKSLMVACQNKRCGEKQFFKNVKCTACGKKIK